MTARYDRAPSPALLALLDEGGLLGPLRRPWTAAGVPLDLQFREGDEVHLYCGLTRLIAARRRADGVRLEASRTYTGQSCAIGLFRAWRDGEHGFDDAVRAYLDGVAVDPRWVRREGRVQAAWMGIREPWVTLDREAVIGRTSSADRTASLDAPAVRQAFEAVDALAVAGGWERPSAPKGANELDQLAVDPEGRLVLVELKDARSGEVAVAPLQSLRYVWEWHTALEDVLPALRALLTARRAVGLVPESTPELAGTLRAVVAWADGSPSTEVLRRLREVKRVVDAHLPEGVGEIEVWSLPDGQPVRVL